MDELVLPSGAPMPKREDEKRMRAAVDRIHGLIQKEIDRGIDSDRIVLAGFSQGESARSLTGDDGSSARLTHLVVRPQDAPRPSCPACRGRTASSVDSCAYPGGCRWPTTSRSRAAARSTRCAPRSRPARLTASTDSPFVFYL